MLTMTANKFSQNPLETLKQVATSDIPAHIVADGYAGVLLSEQEYRNIMATLEIYANSKHAPLEVHDNLETLQAIDDVNNHRNMSRKFSSVDELMEDLNA